MSDGRQHKWWQCHGTVSILGGAAAAAALGTHLGGRENSQFDQPLGFWAAVIVYPWLYSGNPYTQRLHHRLLFAAMPPSGSCDPAAIGKEKRAAGKFALHTLQAHYTQQAQLAAQQGDQGGTTCCEHTEQGQQQQRKRKLQDVAEEDAEVKRALQLRVEAHKLLMTQHLGIVSAIFLAC